MADWLKQCSIETVAMESTGVYGIPVFQVLESRGFEIKLVFLPITLKPYLVTKQMSKNCQWLQKLDSYGLLSGSFRPDDQICVLRSYIRQRDNLICECLCSGTTNANSLDRDERLPEELFFRQLSQELTVAQGN